MNEQYIVSIDQGTTGTRAIVFDHGGAAVSSCSLPHRQIYPQSGWVSHDAEEIYVNAVQCVSGALAAAGLTRAAIAAIGVTNQRETVVCWDAETGAPVADAVVWQCRRTADICKRCESDGMAGYIRQTTGLVVDPYFSATKIKWILDNVPEARRLMDKGRLRAGTMDAYLIFRLTGGRQFATDYSNASRTMLFNIFTKKWDDELLRYFGVPEEILPRFVPTSGYIDTADDFGAPIAAAAGDQQASLFGQACFNDGDVKNTYGTGCFVLKNIGEKPVLSANGLLTTIAWDMGETAYALEGSVFNAGAAIEWIIREMKLVKDVRELNDICDMTDGTDGVYFVPAFSGLGAPFWDMNARGMICGMTLSTNKNHIVRALMEAIAYQSRDVIDCMDLDAGRRVNMLRVDGGVSRSDFTMKFQADMLGIPVERPQNTETTALGAAYLAGLAAGYWKNLEEIRSLRKIDKLFTPHMDRNDAANLYARWREAAERARSYVNVD